MSQKRPMKCFKRDLLYDQETHHFTYYMSHCMSERDIFYVTKETYCMSHRDASYHLLYVLLYVTNRHIYMSQRDIAYHLWGGCD